MAEKDTDVFLDSSAFDYTTEPAPKREPTANDNRKLFQLKAMRAIATILTVPYVFWWLLWGTGLAAHAPSVEFTTLITAIVTLFFGKDIAEKLLSEK